MARRLDPKAQANYIGAGMHGQGWGLEKDRWANPQVLVMTSQGGHCRIAVPSAGGGNMADIPIVYTLTV